MSWLYHQDCFKIPINWKIIGKIFLLHWYSTGVLLQQKDDISKWKSSERQTMLRIMAFSIQIDWAGSLKSHRLATKTTIPGTRSPFELSRHSSNLVYCCCPWLPPRSWRWVSTAGYTRYFGNRTQKMQTGCELKASSLSTSFKWCQTVPCKPLKERETTNHSTKMWFLWTETRTNVGQYSYSHR